MKKISKLIATVLVCSPAMALAGFDSDNSLDWYVLLLLVIPLKFWWLFILCFFAGFAAILRTQLAKGRRGLALLGRSVAFSTLGFVFGYIAIFTAGITILWAIYVK